MSYEAGTKEQRGTFGIKVGWEIGDYGWRNPRDVPEEHIPSSVA